MVKIIFDLFIPAVVEIIRDVEKLNLFELYKLEKKKIRSTNVFRHTSTRTQRSQKNKTHRTEATIPPDI